MKAGSLPLRCIIAPRNFLTVGGCVSGSLLSAHLSLQGSLCLTKVVGGCAKMAGELKWNSQILPPTCRSLIKAPVLFSLAICLLHVSMIVKLCVICCDSFIILESTDVVLLSLQTQQRANTVLLLQINLCSAPMKADDFTLSPGTFRLENGNVQHENILWSCEIIH